VTLAGFDWVDPEDFFVAHVAERPRSFWLDGSGSRPWSGRMTYVGWLEPEESSVTFHAASRTVLAHRAGSSEQIGDDIFEAMERLGGESSTGARSAGWVGFFGYAARTDLPCLNDADPKALDACWLRASRRVAFDHGRRRVFAVCPPELAQGWKAELGQLLGTTPSAEEPLPPPPARVIRTSGPDRYAVAFDEVQRQLRLGNSYETNLTLRTYVASAADPVDTYRRLRRLSPAPYAALITHAGTRVLSSSPERFATIRADRTIEMRPIKGTTARDPDPVLDAAAAERLRTEPKFRGENLMIVDLLRNDLSRVCDVGSVRVTDLMHVESYPSVHQLITTIAGRLRPDVSTLDALRTLFPAGSMTGAPKLRTMQIIADVEDTARGIYSGAVGWLLDDQSADLGVVIRTLVHRGTTYSLGTGGGITVHSRCTDEYAEAGWKARHLLRVLGIEA
jgi:para-aminobenzoate synthetase